MNTPTFFISCPKCNFLTLRESVLNPTMSKVRLYFCTSCEEYISETDLNLLLNPGNALSFEPLWMSEADRDFDYLYVTCLQDGVDCWVFGEEDAEVDTGATHV